MFRTALRRVGAFRISVPLLQEVYTQPCEETVGRLARPPGRWDSLSDDSLTLGRSGMHKAWTPGEPSAQDDSTCARVRFWPHLTASRRPRG